MEGEKEEGEAFFFFRLFPLLYEGPLPSPLSPSPAIDRTPPLSSPPPLGKGIRWTSNTSTFPKLF